MESILVKTFLVAFSRIHCGRIRRRRIKEQFSKGNTCLFAESQYFMFPNGARSRLLSALNYEVC